MLLCVRKSGKILLLPDDDLRRGKKIRRIRGWVHALREYIKRRGYTVKMITLTYREDERWSPRDITEYIERAFKDKKKRWKKGFIGYAWVAETTKKGKIHYHLLVVNSWGTRINTPDLSGEWTHGDSRIETAQTIWYIVKYVGKKYQTDQRLPKGARGWGVWISKDAVINEMEYAYSKIPVWVEKIGRKWGILPRYWPSTGTWEIDGEIVLTSPYYKL